MDHDTAKSWRATLTPHRSLSRRGFFVLMSAIIFLNFSVGGFFLAIGAWPVLGFMGLDVVLIWWAFRRNYASGRIAENIEVTAREVVLERVSEKHGPRVQRFIRRWVKVELVEDRARELIGPLFLRSHGRRTEIASFLAADEKKAFAQALKTALINPLL